MNRRELIFVVNPGSASRKYAVFVGDQKIATVHFELVNGLVVGHLNHQSSQYTVKYDDGNLANTPHRVLPLLRKYSVINDSDKIIAIGIRIVAPSTKFTVDRIINKSFEDALNDLRQEAPSHARNVLLEIRRLRRRFPKVPMVGISDSRFHRTDPDWAKYYAIDQKLAKKLDLEKFGFHGISVESVVDRLKAKKILLPKTIVCHLGSGCSVTAVENGKSIANTMGYSPAEGVMMATRSGNIDIPAALAIKNELSLTDIKLEQYLDKEAGLLGVSGSSSDIRQLVIKESAGDEKAKLALDMFAYRVQQGVGQMAASLNGANCLVFTGTVGERSFIMRRRILERLEYLGFSIDQRLNNKTYEPAEISNIAASDSKPVLVISTDESLEIARRTRNIVKYTTKG